LCSKFFSIYFLPVIVCL